MLITTKAIVISKLKYSDNDLIVKCYTEELGVQSFLLKGILKTKKGKLKKVYFQELSQLELTFNYKESRSLKSLNNASPIVFYKTLHSNIVKSAIVLFLAEIMSSIFKEEEQNKLLYSYLETTLLWLDENDRVTNFHLLFLLNLTKYLGFYPDSQNSELDYFNLEEGRYQNKKTNIYCIYGEKLALFKKLLGTNFDDINNTQFNSVSRQELLKLLLQYFELHLGTIKQPKSLQVLKQVFAS